MLAGALERFHALRHALAAILGFVAAKMLLGGLVEIPSWVSLVVIVGAVASAVVASTRGSGGREARRQTLSVGETNAHRGLTEQ